MGIEFTFYDYIDANGCGANIMNGWLNIGGKPAKAHFNSMIRHLETSPPAGFQDSFWCAPYTWPLHGDWEGFIELRKKVNGVQYRLIAKVEGRIIFLITWGFHKGNWETDITPKTANKRVNQMKTYPGTYRRQHDNS
jgi:hypothetical protein